MLDVANAIAVILGSILAISGLILTQKPDAKRLIDKLTPFQALIGVVMVLLGVINFARAIPYLSDGFRLNAIYAAVILTMLGVSILLGALFGMPQIAKWIPGDSPGEQKALELSRKVAPYEVLLGLLGLASAVIYLLYRFNVVHWRV